MRYIITLVLLITHLSIFSQNCSLVRFQVRPDSNAVDKVDTTVCRGTCLDLYASVPSLKATTSYAVTSIPFVASLPCETGGVASSWGATADDYASPVFPIGFNFCFYGVTYSNFVISPNGFMTFKSAFASEYSSYDATPLPLTPSPQRPENSIYGAWMDIDVSQSFSTGTITYETVGSAPFRALIVKWINCSYFGQACAAGKLNMKIVLYETSNIIDVYIGTKPLANASCPNYVKVSTQGIQGNNTTQFAVTPGRNATIWPVSNDAVRFSPSGVNYPYTVTWFKKNVNLGTGNKLSICPNDDSAFYSATAVINSPCPVALINVSDSVKVRTRPSSFNIINRFDTLNCLNTKTLDALSAVSYNWLNVNNKTRFRTITDSGKYSVVKIVDTINCLNDTMNFFVAKRAPIKIDSTIFSGCFNSSLTGKVNIKTKNGVSPILYGKSLSSLSSNSQLDLIPFGTTKVYVRDTAFCVDSVSFTRDSIVVSNRKYTLNCFNDATGRLKLLATGGTQPYQFKLSTTSYSSIDSFSGLSAGTINASVRDNIGCEVQSAITITQPTKMAATYVVDSVSCFNGSNGKITITTSGGTPGYNFSLNGFASVTSNIFNSLNANTYNIKIRDINNCLIDTNLVLSQNPQLGLNALIDSITCNRIANGKVTLLASGGKGPYTFSKDNITFGSSNVFNSLDTGKYTFWVRDSKNCTNSVTLTLFDPSKLTLNTSVIRNVSCFGLSTGAAKVVASQAKSPYTYLWTNGSTLDSAVGMNFGSKKVVVTDAKGCKDSATVTITQPDSLFFNSISTLTKCFGDSTGKIKLTGVGGVTPYTFSRNASTFSSSDSFVNIPANNYAISIKDANNCVFTKNVTVAQPTKLSASYAIDSVSCFNGSNGKITITGVGGTPNYRFSLNNATAVSSNIFSGLTANTYNVKLRDTNNCLVDTNLVVSQFTQLNLATVVDSITCFNAANGKVTLTASGGKGPYTFSKDNITYSASNIFSNLGIGTHNLFAKDANNCIATRQVVLSQPTKLNVSASIIRNVSCFGQSTGAAKVVATQATAPYTFIWTNGSTLDSAIGMNFGSKKVVVTDAKGCKDSATVTITQPDSLFFNSISTLTKCFGDSSGKIKLTGVGGVTPYTFSRNASTFSSSDSFVNIPANNYSISIKDANNCVFTKNVTVAQPTKLSATYAIDSVSCFNGSNGKITITGSGGTPNYRFSLNNATAVSSNIFSGLTANTYNVKLRDTNNCLVDTNLVVSQFTQLNLTTVVDSITCFNAANGKVTLTASGGKGPYTFSKDNITYSASNIFSNLGIGTHNLFAKDANNCIVTKQVVLSQPTQLNLALGTIKNVLCFGQSTGTAKVIATFATPPYTYLWVNGSTLDSAIGLNAGGKKVVVTDAKGCKDSIIATILQPDSLFFNSVSTLTKCFGDSTGKITLTGVGGVTPYTFSRNASTFSSSDSLVNIPANNYSISIKDANNCVFTKNVTVAQPTKLSATYAIDSVSCFNGSNGKITITGSGGTPNYRFSLNNATAVSSNIFSGLTANTYNVKLRDTNNCLVDTNLVVSQFTQLNLATVVDSISCFNAANGKVTLTASGGKGPYTFSKDNITYSASNIFSNLGIGTHNLFAKDANNCITTRQVVLSQPTKLNVSASIIRNVSCFGQSTGAAKVVATQATAPYTYIWTNGSTLDSAVGMNFGSKKVVVTDAKGCKDSATVTITQPDSLFFNSISTLTKCFGDSTGKIKLTGVGGVTPYTFSRDAGAFSSSDSFVNIPANNYSISIKDANNCVFNNTVVVAQPSLLTKTTQVDSVKCFNGNSGKITVTGNGGTTPYTFSLQNASYVSTNVFGSLTAGTYSISVKDANNCKSDTSLVISQYPQILAAITNTDIVCNNNDIGKIDVIGSGGNPSYTYSLDSVSFKTGTNFSNLAAGAYTVFVKDANNCVRKWLDTIKQTFDVATIFNKKDVNCFGFSDGNFTVKGSGGVSPFTYSFNNGAFASTDSFSNLVAGNYNVITIDQVGCKDTIVVSITQPSALLYTTVVDSVKCFGQSTGKITVNASGGTTPYTYIMDGTISQTTNIFPNLISDTFAIRVRDAKQCIKDTQIILNTYPDIKFSFTLDSVKCHNAFDGSTTVSVIGGLAPYQYKLDANSFQNNNIISNIGYGAHSVVIKDVYNCQKSFSFSYANPTKLTTTLLNQINILCNGDTTGFAAISSSGGRLPHTYLWNNGSTNDTLPKIIAGVYTVTTTDAKGCTDNIQVTITQPQALSFAWSNANLTCFRDTTGLASVRVSGGVAPYKYLWNTGDSISLISKLLAGDYTVTVTDKNGCKRTETQTLTEPAIISFTIDKVNSSCFESKNGSLTVNNIKGGTAPYNLKWEDNSFNNILTNVQAFRNYSVQVFDVNSCVRKDSGIVDTNYRLRVNPQFIDPKCPNSITDVLLVPENGVATYTYKLNGITNNSGVYNSLPNGLYLFEAKDGVGCMYKDTADLVLKDSMRPTLINYDPDCQTANIWPSKLNVVGGAQPYTFNWTGAIFTNSTGDSAIHNKKGTYSVTVKDNNNCSLSYSFDLKPADGAIDVSIDSLYNLRCFGVPEGKAVINVKGGMYPYSYSWSHGDKDSIGSNMFANVKYTVSVTDDSGCRYILDDIYLNEPTRIQAKYASRNESCPNLFDAYILVNPYNGTATNSQSYWIKLNDQPFTKEHRYSFLTKGTYKVTIRDENECEVDTTFVITSPPEIKLSLDSVYEVEAGSSVDMFPNIQVIGGTYTSLDYLWTPNESLKCADCINNTFYGAKNSELEFSIKFGENCEVKANTRIKIKGLDGELIYIPNVFNPSDKYSENQTFKIFGTKIKRYNLEIYNRWGEKVFDSHTQENAWNGMYKGEYAQPGEYIYIAEVEMLDGQILKRKGTFAFIR